MGRTVRRRLAEPDRLSTGDGPVLPSLMFWLCLFAAGALFAAAALSPKVITSERLRRHSVQLEEKLVRLNQRNQDLQQIANALAHDPEFVAELARVEYDAAPADEQRLPAPSLTPRSDLEDPFDPQRTTADLWGPAAVIWFPIAEQLASDPVLNNLFLFTAAGLTIAAFTFFPYGENPRSRG